MPSLVYVTSEIMPKSHLPADTIQNSFVFAGAGSSAATAVAAEAAVVQFYNGVEGDSAPIAHWLASFVDRTIPVMLKSYELSGDSLTTPAVHVPPGLGSPIHMSTFTMAGGVSGPNLPAQIAVALSYASDLIGAREHSGPGPRTAERRRGRVYLGPLSATAADVDPTTGAPVVAAAMITSMRRAFLEVAQAVDCTWMIWSRKDQLCREIVQGHADNRFDTQRRRDQLPTFRATWQHDDVIG